MSAVNTTSDLYQLSLPVLSIKTEYYTISKDAEP